MATLLETLIVKLGGDTDELRKSLDAAESSLQKFQRKVKKGAKGIAKDFKRMGQVVGKIVKTAFVAVTAAATAATAAIAGAVKASADQADLAAKTAQRLGLTIDAYQKLSFAAKEAGVEGENFNVAFASLNRNLTQAANGSASAQQKFSRLGIDIKDVNGNVKAADQVFLELSDRLGQLPDGALKSGLALDIMGESGARMIALMNQGSASISATGDEAQRLGIVFSQQGAAQAESFNDTLGRMWQSIAGVRNEIAQRFFPIFTELAAKLTEFFVNNRAQIVDLVMQGWQYLRQVVLDVMAIFNGNEGAVVNTWLITTRDGINDLVAAARGLFEVFKMVAGVLKAIQNTAASVTALLGGVSREDRVAAGLAFADGGVVSGPGTGRSDSVLARVSNGEGILTARAVGHYGENVVHALNSLRLPKFADGGVVGSPAAASGTPVNVHFGSQTFSLEGSASEVGRMKRAGRTQLAIRPRWAGR